MPAQVSRIDSKRGRPLSRFPTPGVSAARLALIALLLLASVAGCSTAEREVPQLSRSRAAVIDVVRLSPGARRALVAYDPGFFVTGCRDAVAFEKPDEPGVIGGDDVPPDAAFTVEGDFNGDGDRDLAVLGMTASHRALLALFCAGDDCSVTEVERWPRTRRGECEGRLFLMPESPGLKRSPREARPLRLKHDAVRIYYDQASQAILYYRQRDGFQSFILR